ncbi:MAG: hypothetical protein KC657_31130 [Myxococcales bacterium]|nr:hypothetical protein [Myxococcales bacterium]
MRKSLLLTSLLAGALALGSTGCLKSMILNGQIASTRKGAKAADTLGDYEVARAASSAGLVQFEGMHRLAPDNEDALYLLLRGWAGYGYAFAQDDYEVALIAGDDAAAEYHKGRAKLAFDRAISYGLELIGKHAEGFEENKKDADTIKKWLEANFDSKDHAETLFWLGGAWLARVNLLKDDPTGEYVANLFIGVAILERSVAIDPEYLSWGGTSTLATYHARGKGPELEEAKKMFELALQKTGRKSLGVQLNYAKYFCMKQDQAGYEKIVNEVLSTEDPDPNLRLQNTIAKRRAKRALHKSVMEDCGFPPKEAPATPTE